MTKQNPFSRRGFLIGAQVFGPTVCFCLLPLRHSWVLLRSTQATKEGEAERRETLAMYRIVFSGVFDRYPSTRIVTHHHGGFVPYYAPRMSGSWIEEEDSGRISDTKISRPYIDHFRKFYCDTACNEFAPKSLELALDFFGPERVLFGSDAPFGAKDGQRYTSEVLRSIDSMTINPDVRKSVLSANATRILKIT